MFLFNSQQHSISTVWLYEQLGMGVTSLTGEIMWIENLEKIFRKPFGEIIWIENLENHFGCGGSFYYANGGS